MGETSTIAIMNSPTATTHFDPNGDLKIKVGSETNSELFIVSSKAMSLVCKPWKAMFGSDSKFLEGTRSSDTIIPLPEDNVEALRILVNAAHLRFSSVPPVLNFSTLVQVAILCDKYGAAELVQPWLSVWLNAAQSHSESLIHEGWLLIAWTFGLSSKFRHIANLMVHDLGARRFELNECQHHLLKWRNGRMVEEYYLPPGILGNPSENFLITNRAKGIL